MPRAVHQARGGSNVRSAGRERALRGVGRVRPRLGAWLQSTRITSLACLLHGSSAGTRCNPGGSHRPGPANFSLHRKASGAGLQEWAPPVQHKM